jgi:hypothetical protein
MQAYKSKGVNWYPLHPEGSKYTIDPTLARSIVYWNVCNTLQVPFLVWCSYSCVSVSLSLHYLCFLVECGTTTRTGWNGMAGYKENADLSSDSSQITGLKGFLGLSGGPWDMPASTSMDPAFKNTVSGYVQLGLQYTERPLKGQKSSPFLFGKRLDGSLYLYLPIFPPPTPPHTWKTFPCSIVPLDRIMFYSVAPTGGWLQSGDHYTQRASRPTPGTTISGFGICLGRYHYVGRSTCHVRRNALSVLRYICVRW